MVAIPVTGVRSVGRGMPVAIPATGVVSVGPGVPVKDIVINVASRAIMQADVRVATLKDAEGAASLAI